MFGTSTTVFEKFARSRWPLHLSALFLSPLPSHLLRRHSIRRAGTHLVGNCRRNFEAQCPERMSKRKLIIVFKKVPPVDYCIIFAPWLDTVSYTNDSWSTPFFLKATTQDLKVIDPYLVFSWGFTGTWPRSPCSIREMVSMFPGLVTETPLGVA